MRVLIHETFTITGYPEFKSGYFYDLGDVLAREIIDRGYAAEAQPGDTLPKKVPSGRRGRT